MKYVGYRYGARFDHEFATLEEAVQSAAVDFEYGEASYECVTDDDGNVILNKEAFSKAIYSQLDEWDKERSATG